ncbi:MAG: flagellar hook-length control protein FliK [Proteobacteria bacterium]|nr:flagellar hook-length control protein FliK [Pseudomonadota bacterium]
MLPNSSAVSLVQNFLRTQEGVIEVATPTSPDQTLVTVGERVQATVTDQLPNGRFAVLIKDQLLDLNLPSNTQPGDKLDLVVLAKNPGLTFGLSGQSQTPALKSSDNNVALSQTGKLLGDLLVRADGQSKVADLQQTQPLFEGTPQPAQLAGQLATRLAESGLFYESHQAEWVSGDRSLQTLLREPQARLLSPAAGQNVQTQFPGGEQAAAPAGSDVMQTQSAQQGRMVDSEQPLVQRNSVDTQLAMEQIKSPEQVVRHLAQQQLELVENHPLVWQGEAWPGQPLRWKLELENERQPEAQSAEPVRVWQTRLDLNLPRLGSVTVVANLRSGQFDLRFEAQDPATISLLQAKQPVLADRFAAAGLPLTSSLVQRHVDEAQS